jgi:hypothetical protein
MTPPLLALEGGLVPFDQYGGDLFKESGTECWVPPLAPSADSIKPPAASLEPVQASVEEASLEPVQSWVDPAEASLELEEALEPGEVSLDPDEASLEPDHGDAASASLEVNKLLPVNTFAADSGRDVQQDQLVAQQMHHDTMMAASVDVLASLDEVAELRRLVCSRKLALQLLPSPVLWPFAYFADPCADGSVPGSRRSWCTRASRSTRMGS